MISNYPPGVTGNEPQIAGVTHHPQCPLHEDNPVEHSCSQKARYGTVEWNWDWHLVLKSFRRPSSIYVLIQFCPFCGEELPIISCQCREITEALREPREV